MNEYKVINEILKDSKSKNILLIGFKSGNLIEFILKYVKINSGKLMCIDSKPKINVDDIVADKNNFTLFRQDSLIKLADFQDYDAVFIDGNPNWYTVYNELNIIENNCKKFPLIFICNAVFPNERRDAYYYFDNIPSHYQQINSKKLIIFRDITNESKKIVFKDDHYHAIYSNTEKNGVLTAIEDYVQKTTLNVDKTLIDSETGLIFLFFKNHPIYKKFSELGLTNDFYNFKVKNEYLNKFLLDLFESNSEEFLKAHNEHLINQISEYRSINHDLSNLLNSKEKLLNLKDKLIAADDELILSQELLLNSKNKLITSKDKLINSKDDLIKSNNELINCKNLIIRSKDKELLSKDKELQSKDILFKYNDLSINFLKSSKFRFIKIILSYLYIISKFKFDHDLKLNLKLFSLMNSVNWFNIGFYLENNKDIHNSKWLKILTPEVHYICKGYYEERLPNPDFNKKLKKEDIIKILMGDSNDE